jgi:hypothetical protein
MINHWYLKHNRKPCNKTSYLTLLSRSFTHNRLHGVLEHGQNFAPKTHATKDIRQDANSGRLRNLGGDKKIKE